MGGEGEEFFARERTLSSQNSEFVSSFLAPGPGLEPGLTDPESAVLPLDDPGTASIF